MRTQEPLFGIFQTKILEIYAIKVICVRNRQKVGCYPKTRALQSA